MLVDEMRTAPLHRGLRDHLLALGVGLALLAVSWLYLAWTHRGLEPWERDLFTAVNDLSDAFRPVLWPPMQLGNFWVWIVAVPILICCCWRFPLLAGALVKHWW